MPQTPRIIDSHVHFFPEPVFKAIWTFFETESKGLWPIHYKQHGEEIVNTLKEQGVERFTTLVYAHKEQMADYLNGYIYEASQKYPELIPFGTLFVGDGHVLKRAQQIFEDYQFQGIKLHPFVSKEAIDDKRYFPAYELMAELGKVLLCHPGSGPVYQETDGALRLKKVLKEFPQLKVIIAHCGAFEYDDYTQLADEFQSVFFDTAMNCVCTQVFHNNCPGPSFFKKHQDRILFGTDFPNIPYHYQEQIAGIPALNLGKKIEGKIYYKNAARLFGID